MTRSITLSQNDVTLFCKQAVAFALCGWLLCLLPTPATAFQNRNKRKERMEDRFVLRPPLSRSADRRGVQTRPANNTQLRFGTIDGTYNNLRQPTWGVAGVNLWRKVPNAYADGISVSARIDMPSPREISNTIFDQTTSRVNDRNLTDMVWQWGQFIDHDIDLTESHVPLDPLPIVIPTGDLFFDHLSTGLSTMHFFRSEYNPNTGVDTPREQVNLITTWIDGSNVYGSDEETMNNLRQFRNGMMKVRPGLTGQLLPTDADGFFMAGDIRANEQVYLTSMHTLWVREHNRRCRDIASRNPNMSDEQIFLNARRQVVALMQGITFNEFLPALLGEGVISRYRGYDNRVFPNIANGFSTAAFRFGHSMLSSNLLRVDQNGDPVAGGSIALQNAFFSPDEVRENGIECHLLGLTMQRAQEIDSNVISDVRNFLFGPPGAGGFDLVSLNIQRGRDHGLGSLTDFRRRYRLEPIRSFADITSDPILQLKLDALYGSVENVDPWVGMLCEDHVPGSSLGPTAMAVIKDQFERLRDGDRFWYENQFDRNAIERINSTTLSDIIRRNTVVTKLRRDVFHLPEE